MMKSALGIYTVPNLEKGFFEGIGAFTFIVQCLSSESDDSATRLIY